MHLTFISRCFEVLIETREVNVIAIEMERLQLREESISEQDRQIGGQKNVNCLRKREELNNSFYLHIRVF